MESTATVEQAEPQGSAAPGQDTSAPASVDGGPASPPSFGSLFKQRVMDNAARREGRAGASSADRETSAADEQPAPSTAPASRPGAAATGVDGTASADAEPSDQPRLTRAERKALKTGQPSAATPNGTAAADTSTAPSEDDDSDPVVARVERVEKTVTEGLSRLEGLLGRPTPAEADATEDPASVEYRKRYGDDAEFNRRAQIALHGATTGQYLDTQESEELTAWALRREGRDDGSRAYQGQFSGLVMQAAEAFGVSPETISRPGTTFRDIFGAFVGHGSAKQAAELIAAQERAAKLEQANQLLADENEALLARLPASARSVLAGGASASSRDAALADRTRMNGRQAMRAGLERAANGRRNRPAAR